MPASLDAGLNPASVAIIGASDNPHKVGGRPLLYLQRYGYRGAIYPINPGLANFATGMVANFSTIFHELEGRDGPVAIVSQSGANSQAIYTLLRENGVSARHVHATGNEADVTIADLAAAVVRDPGVRLVL